ncbi:MAG: hypothetical protein HY815_08390 [Candidatus Riflebacteria bacterium]|nr:hypothetical protein [Candidatus Riflebacteria bacterium]
MKLVGFDFGSVYTKAVVLGIDGSVEISLYEKKAGDGALAIERVLSQVALRFPDGSFKLGITGIDPSGLDRWPVCAVNPVVAITVGLGAVCPTSSLSHSAARAATIAGRCAVFAKSDMIHLQQKGTPTEEIAYGLCMAICRNALMTLLKGRELTMPVVIAGGCARNRGIVRAFEELLALSDPAHFLVSPHPGLEGALGAALEAREHPAGPLDLAALRQAVPAALEAHDQGRSVSLAPLPEAGSTPGAQEPERSYDEPMDGFLGVDVGSVSTDLVVLGTDGSILSAVYLPTRGHPVEAVQRGLAILRDRFKGGLRVIGCGTTGSGRHLAARLIGADVVKNEITCQLLGAGQYFDDVDTIFEIGGQDSKFISTRDGQVADFVMNKICAAGTGSFIEEQAREMEIDVFRDFARCAFRARKPRDLGSRCTVFMETEIVNSLSEGASVDDVCGGLAYSIVNNYLEKVVGNRPVGRSIVFQGGVASNAAVVAAFQQVLGRPIKVHPYNRISGAIGAAIASRELAKEGRVSCFKGLDTGPRPSLKSFECKQCSNSCEVNVIEVASERIFFGDTCERYTSRGTTSSKESPIANLAEEYHSRCEQYFPRANPRGVPTVGLPRASTLLGYLPFWGTFFTHLGFHPVLSLSSSQETLELGLKHLPVGVCLPIKLMAGHANALLQQGVDFVFVPAVVVLPGDVPSRSYACPYTMAVPFMISNRMSSRTLEPPVYLTDEETFANGFAECRAALGVTRLQLREAFRAASVAQAGFDESFAKWTAGHCQKGRHRFLFGVLGKPYNTFDAFLNLNLFERLRKLDILAVPLRYLPIDWRSQGSDLPWRLSADIHRAALALASEERIFPVTISNFGCGPDAFTFKRIGEALQERPHLILEFDEHRGEAGLVTRLEAFVDQIEGTRGRAVSPRGPRSEESDPREMPGKGARVRLPYFADHAFAFSGLWKSQGYDAQVLPLPDEGICALGEKHSLGKECHPYAMIAGDLLDLHRKHPDEDLVFYFPNSAVPCLLQQYGRGMQILLNELGIKNLKVCSPTGTELFSEFGIDACDTFYQGLFAIELLAKAVCQIRPYEKMKGATDAIHRQNLLRIESAIGQGQVLEALDECLRQLAAVEVNRGERYPIVGVTGDVYTKVNPAANRDLFRWFEDRGIEVWPSPFQIDYLDFGISRRVLQSISNWNFSNFVVDASILLRTTIDSWRIRYTVGDRISRLEEPGYREMQRLAAPYMPNDAHEILFLNIAKIVDYARSGADGIVNAVCFNCMVGNAAAAIIEKIRRDYHDVPIVTAVYSGREDPSRKMILEAFVTQVKTFHNSRGA